MTRLGTQDDAYDKILVMFPISGLVVVLRLWERNGVVIKPVLGGTPWASITEESHDGGYNGETFPKHGTTKIYYQEFGTHGVISSLILVKPESGKPQRLTSTSSFSPISIITDANSCNS